MAAYGPKEGYSFNFSILYIMKKNGKKALLKSYQNELIRFINANPEAIYEFEWGVLTNGFNSELIKDFVMGINEEFLMEKFVDHLKFEWNWREKEHVPSIYLDEKRSDLKYGSTANPVRFSTFMDELKLQWIIVKI